MQINNTDLTVLSLRMKGIVPHKFQVRETVRININLKWFHGRPIVKYKIIEVAQDVKNKSSCSE